MRACCFGRRATFTPKQIQVVSTIYFDLSVDTDEILDNVRYSEEEDFLLDILERFNPKNIHAALRKHFALCKKEGLPIPDFIKKKEL